MKSRIVPIAVAVGCSTLLLGLALAQSVAKHVPAKAKPPPEPVTVTAVAPKGPINPGKHAIIFVGGHTQSGGDSALNPQPIPPGHPVLVNPPH
jgi:hypothetical protein